MLLDIDFKHQTKTNHYCPFQLDLQLKSGDGGDISTYVTNGEWALIGSMHYDCGVSAYVDGSTISASSILFYSLVIF